MNPFELIIFDCDGVLVDSEHITINVLTTLLNEMGIVVTADEIYGRFHGRSSTQWLAQIAEILGEPLPETFFPTLRQRAAVALWEQVTPIDGIVETLDTIQTPVCVASSGDPDKMALTLGRTGLLPRFGEKVYSVRDVQRPKPFPDIYLHAARENGVRPSQCAVIEDSPTGVLAAVTAGMFVFGYCADTPQQQLQHAGAQVLFADMRQLPLLLAWTTIKQNKTAVFSA